MVPRERTPRILLLLLLANLALALNAAEGPLVAARSTWKYLDDGSDQGTAWREVAFDDSRWASGPAELGYGDGDEATVVGYGPDPLRRYITTYFRQSFQVADPAAITSLRLRLIRDDGAVVYINGTEVRRDNMPTGPIGYRTASASTVSDAAERTWFESTLSSSILRAGTNVVAVEVHQSGGSSSDLSFALELLGEGVPPTPNLTRGPYLQIGTPTSVIVRWRTDIASNSRVRYGTSLSSLDSVVDDAAQTTEHEVTLTGLAPLTRYYYAVETSTARVAGGTEAFTFTTSPSTGTALPTRIWVLGDSGTGGGWAASVRDAYYRSGGLDTTNLVLLLGDNAYNSGLDEEYQRAMFDMYPEMLRKTVFWPTIGNHETANLTNPSPTIPYFNIFTAPTQGEAGGLPSGTERYYSFDYGNIHFICLDSMTSDRSPTGPMLTWLRDDLASTTQPWIVAFWHHPPYSKGSHDSDYETPLVEMRKNAVPILEEGGADIILAGHSHSYERSYLLHGHYGSSTTLTSSMKVDGGDGRVEGTGAYRKGATSTAPYIGTVYAVAGSAGLTSGGDLNHPAMYISLNDLGSMILDVNGPKLHATFLRYDGTVGDWFTIDKTRTTQTVPSAPTSTTATAASPTSINVAWTATSTNHTGFRVERCAGAGCTNFAQVAQVTAQSYADSGLTASTLYRYRVLAYNDAGNSAPSNIAEATTPAPQAPPAAPTALAANPTSSTTVALSWTDNSSDETGFRVERCAGAGCTSFMQIAQTTAPSYADSGLTAGTLYRYRVFAFNAAGASAASNVAEATTPGLTPPAPSNAAATATSSTIINVTWTASSTNHTGFRVERCAGAGCTNFAQVTLTTSTSFVNTNLTPATLYRYRIIAYNASGDSAPSNIAEATTFPPPPAAPTSLTGFSNNGSTITINWADNSSNEEGFTIERCTGQNCTGFVKIATVDANVKTFVNSGLSRNTTYRYRVRAFNAGGASAYSNSATIRTDNK